MIFPTDNIICSYCKRQSHILIFLSSKVLYTCNYKFHFDGSLSRLYANCLYVNNGRKKNYCKHFTVHIILVSSKNFIYFVCFHKLFTYCNGRRAYYPKHTSTQIFTVILLGMPEVQVNND